MSPRRSVDDKLDELEAEVEAAGSDALAEILGRSLADRNYRVVALAAHFASDRLVYDCVPALLDAYPSFLEDAVKRDPNCLAKKAIVRALHTLDCDDVNFYLAALRYRQMEPVWGGSVDTATDVRVGAAMGLVASGYPRALVDVSELLFDSESPVRAGAARAIACGSPREAELLLRLKILSGDEDPLVIGECMGGLLAVEPDEAPDFVTRFLDDDDDAVREAAALALGESRLPVALEALQDAWDGILVESWFKRVLIRGAALHRSDEAFDWLLGLAAETNSEMAVEIVDVLAIYRHNAALAERLQGILRERSDPEPLACFDLVWV